MTPEEIKALQAQIEELTAVCAQKDAAIVEAQAAATHATEHAEALGREIEALTSQLATALETAASEKARADRGDVILQSAALAVPVALIEARAKILRAQQAEAQAAADEAAKQIAALGASP